MGLHPDLDPEYPPALLELGSFISSLKQNWAAPTGAGTNTYLSFPCYLQVGFLIAEAGHFWDLWGGDSDFPWMPAT